MNDNFSSTHFKKKNYQENKKFLFLLIPIGIISFFIKNIFFEPEIALTFDSLKYFFYATDIAIFGQLPENYFLANNFWSIFLAVFFQMFSFENTIQYMDLQKQLSMIISTITIIPIYFLSRRFFEPKYSIIASLIFACEPRIFYNSMLGITESLYILLGTLSIFLFLSSNKKIIYLSFLVVGITTITRAEGQMLFLAMSVMYFVRFRNEKLVVPKYFIGLGIFAIIVVPMIMYQYEIQENDLIFGRAVNTISYHTQDPTDTGGESGIPFFVQGVENYVKFFIWDLIPIFIFFVPFGIILLFLNRDHRKWTLILCGIGISIPAFYAYSIPLLDTRYLFMLYPIFGVISLFAIKRFTEHFKRKNLILGLIVIGIILSASIFLELKPLENKQKLEAYEIAKEVVKETRIMNSYYPEERYTEPAILPEKWNDFKDLFFIEREMTKSVKDSISNPITFVSTNGYSSIEEFIQKNSELTHLYVDEKNDRIEFLKEIFENEKKYEFLEKQYDSKENGFNYHVKIFKINQ